MESFSDTFLSAFPPRIAHHNSLTSLEVYHNITMTPYQKSVIINEVKSNKITQVDIAKYLQITKQRVKNLIYDDKHGKIFREEPYCPSRIDEIGCSNIAAKIIAGNDKKKPYKKSETY
jgi:hypothetical protein